MHQDYNQRYFLICADIYWKENRIRNINMNIMCANGLFIPTKVRDFIKDSINKKTVRCDCAIITNVFELGSVEFYKDYGEKSPPHKATSHLVLVNDNGATV